MAGERRKGTKGERNSGGRLRGRNVHSRTRGMHNFSLSATESPLGRDGKNAMNAAPRRSFADFPRKPIGGCNTERQRRRRRRKCRDISSITSLHRHGFSDVRLRGPQFYRADLETPRPTVALCGKLFGECLVGILRERRESFSASLCSPSGGIF